MSIYYHKHHILPKHMGGSDDPSNLVLVTVEEHANLHKQLWEDLGHWEDKIAWNFLSGQISKQEAIRQAQSLGAKNRRKRCGKENHFYGKSHTKRTKELISNSRKGIIPYNKGVFGKNNPNSRLWEITDPENRVFQVRGLAQFCRENKLHYQTMGQVARGKFKQHKGYYCKEIT